MPLDLGVEIAAHNCYHLLREQGDMMKRREEEMADRQRLLLEMEKRHEEETGAFLQYLQALEYRIQKLMSRKHEIGRHRDDLARERTAG